MMSPEIEELRQKFIRGYKPTENDWAIIFDAIQTEVDNGNSGQTPPQSSNQVVTGVFSPFAVDGNAGGLRYSAGATIATFYVVNGLCYANIRMTNIKRTQAQVPQNIFSVIGLPFSIKPASFPSITIGEFSLNNVDYDSVVAKTDSTGTVINFIVRKDNTSEFLSAADMGSEDGSNINLSVVYPIEDIRFVNMQVNVDFDDDDGITSPPPTRSPIAST